MIQTGSGGQSRRVSLAISLLHDPKLIILDEPTVGIDPLLRNDIWDELRRMVEYQQKTIIITTHYIEEANQAHRIGLMRNGVLIEEANPMDILIKHGSETLEEAFLMLCCNQEKNNIVQNGIRTKKKMQSKTLTDSESNFNFNRVKALVKKNAHVSFRDYFLFFIMFVLPVIQVVNFCSAIGTNFKDMPIAINNDEVSLLDCYKTNVDGCIFDKNNNQTMSCVVVNYLLSHNYKLVEVKTHEAGEISMKDPNYMAFLHFPKNYTTGLLNFIDDRENFDLESAVYAQLTRENFLLRTQIRSDLFKSISHLITKTLNSCSINPKSASTPLEFNILFGEKLTSFGNSTINVFMAITIFTFPQIFASTMMLSEKLNGVLSRSMFAGVKISEIITSLMVLDTLLIIPQIIVTFLISYMVFPNSTELTSGLFLYLWLMILLAWIGFLLGIMIAAISTTQFGSNLIVNGIGLSHVILSGIGWPVEGQPKYLRMFSELVPVRLFGKLLNDITLKGQTWSHPSIIFGTGVAFVYTLIFLLALILLRKFKKDLWVEHK